jgi:peptide/nickel transport system ATP-binding protein
MTSLLEVKGLGVSFRSRGGVVRAVDGVSLSLSPGEVVGIVGESGSGKSVTMLAVMGLLDRKNTVLDGEVYFKGQSLMNLSPREMCAIRGREMAMIFQEPMTALTPVYRVGSQIAEQVRVHEHVSRRAARVRAVNLLSAVGIPEAHKRVDDFPHQFSGGMRQRVMIAMALSCNPSVLIADEPTTALDVTIEAQILDLLRRLGKESGTAILLITHDMGVIADLADRVYVMYAGRVAEQATTDELFAHPRHPYTWGLLGSIPRLDRPKPRRLAAIPGTPPSILDLGSGCRFQPRCVHALPVCCEQNPTLRSGRAAGHLDACFLKEDQKDALSVKLRS